MIRQPVHTIAFGGITMVEDGASVPDANGCTYTVSAQDTTLGNPESVTTALLTLMSTGSAVAWERTGNRLPVLRVKIKASDLDELARGEKALQAECEKPNTLSWTPPDGVGRTSVFDIVWSSLELVTDDLGDLRRERTYLVRVQALPHAREPEPVLTPAQTTATETVIDDGTSATGWSANTGVISVVSGAVTNTYAPNGGTITMTRSGAFTLAGTEYLAITWKASAPSAAFVTIKVSGQVLPEVLRLDAGSGFFTSFYRPPSGGSFPDLPLAWNGKGFGSQTFNVDKVSKWSALPFIGTDRQKALSLVPGGSVRTSGSIAVEHGSNALGKTIVYTHPSGTGYLPPLRQWLVSSDTVTPDATLVSGARNPIAGNMDFNIPASALPRGRVELWARMRADSTTAFPLIWTVESWINGTSLSPSDKTITLSLPAGSAWLLVPIGVAVVPPVDIGPAGYVRVKLRRDPGSAVVVDVDEAYLFATDEGRLTIVDCGTDAPSAGGSSNRLWIDAPSLDSPTGGIYRGAAADRSDAFHAGGDSEPWQVHDFDPDGTSIFVATFNTTAAETSLTHYRRYHTHVSSQ